MRACHILHPSTGLDAWEADARDRPSHTELARGVAGRGWWFFGQLCLVVVGVGRAICRHGETEADRPGWRPGTAGAGARPGWAVRTRTCRCVQGSQAPKGRRRHVWVRYPVVLPLPGAS